MGLFKSIFGGKGANEETSKAEQKSAVDVIVENIGKHAQGGQRILDALDDLDFEAYEVDAKIPVDKLAAYMSVVDGIREVIQSAKISDVDTTELDKNIEQMVALFGTAVENGNESTATSILKGIGKSVQYTRTPYVYENDEQREEKKRIRHRDVEYLLAIARFQDYLDRIERNIKALEDTLPELESRLNDAVSKEQAMLQEDPDLMNKVRRVQMKLDTITPSVASYVNAFNKAAKLKNQKATTELLLTKKEKNKIEVEDCKDSINLMKFGSHEMFGTIALEQMTHLVEDFKEDEKRAENLMRNMASAQKEMLNMFDTMFDNMITDDDLITMRNYHEALEAEKKEEAERKQRVKEAAELKETQKEIQSEVNANENEAIIIGE